MDVASATPSAVIRLQILEAHGLADCKNPYCGVRLGDKIERSGVGSAGSHPAWGAAEGSVTVTWDAEDFLEITIREKGSALWSEDSKIGTAHVNVSALARLAHFRGSLQVFRRGTEKAGELAVDLLAKEVSPMGPAKLLQPALVRVHSNGLMGAVAAVADFEALDIFKTYHVVLWATSEKFGDMFNSNWDEEHKKLFKDPLKKVVQAEHASLYSDGVCPHFTYWGGKRNERATLGRGNDFLSLLGNGVRKGRRRVYTYVVLDEGMFFSETGANIAKDFFSKHAVHANASPEVRMAGTFRICETPERALILILDNDSGTYRPSSEQLPILKEVLELNFPGLLVRVLDVTQPQPQDILDFAGPNETKGSKACVYAGQWKWKVESEDELQASSLQAAVSVWEWKNRNGWQRYLPEDECLLDQLQVESKGQQAETSGFSFGRGTTYKVDFLENVQTNLKTGRVREMRQILSGCYVPSWEIHCGGIEWKACSFHDAVTIEQAYLATAAGAPVLLTLSSGEERLFDFKMMTCAGSKPSDVRALRRLASSGV